MLVTDTVISPLSVDGEYFCDVLEDRDRGIFQYNDLSFIKELKIKHETAIPYGTYQVVISYSNRFKKYLPELLDVPGFSGIRMHPGNTKDHTSGCILPGKRKGKKVISSRITFNKLFSKMKYAAKREKIFVEILPTDET